MSTSTPEVKPEVPSSHVTIKVKSQDDTSVFFRIKRNVMLRTTMQAFSDKVGKEISALRFLFDGIKIKPDQTPNELELEDGDEIDAFGEQIGGFNFCH